MTRRGWIRSIAAAAWLFSLQGCEETSGPKLSGEVKLSSQLFGTESYYLYGYSFEKGEMYRYPFSGDPVPDIINEGFLVKRGSEWATLPGFNTPGRINGFALVGEFPSSDQARAFYEAYQQVESGLQFETVSDTVRLHQVWVQLTSADNYVKLLVKGIREFESESERMNSEVTLEYTYQPDGSTTFPD